MKMLLQLFIVCLALRAFSMEASNSYVSIQTACADVLSIKPVGKDFHLLVVNASAQATVEVSAIDPWELVEPISGSCGVTLAAEGAYEVKDAEPDEEGNYEPNKDGRIIMFKPTFSVSPSFPSGVYELKEDASGRIVEHVIENTRGDLTDNHTSIVNVHFTGGIGSLKGHEARMPVKPEMAGRPLLHHESVDPNNVSVQIDVSKNKWTTSKIFWYGLSDMANGCCYWNRFNYIFELYVDGILCDSHKYNVGWPRGNPSVEFSVCPLDSLVYPAQYCVGDTTTEWCVTIEFFDYIKMAEIVGIPYSSQYSAETKKEEEYHQKQDCDEVPIDKGGGADLYTARGMMYHADQNTFFEELLPTSVRVDPANRLLISESRDDLIDAFGIVYTFCKAAEENASAELRRKRRKFAEYHAKKAAGYNAAWKYHCVYGNGTEDEPPYEIHPAYVH